MASTRELSPVEMAVLATICAARPGHPIHVHDLDRLLPCPTVEATTSLLRFGLIREPVDGTGERMIGRVVATAEALDRIRAEAESCVAGIRAMIRKVSDGQDPEHKVTNETIRAARLECLKACVQIIEGREGRTTREDRADEDFAYSDAGDDDEGRIPPADDDSPEDDDRPPPRAAPSRARSASRPSARRRGPGGKFVK